MNKPVPGAAPDDDIGPVDADGQQIWSPEEEEAIARLHRDPAYWAAIEEAEESFRQGHFYTQEQVEAACAERRRRYLADRNR